MTTTEEEIRTVGIAWIGAELAADVATLDALATDDFHLVGPFGFVLDKQQWLDRYRSGDFATSALTPLIADPFGSVSIVRTSGEPEGK